MGVCGESLFGSGSNYIKVDGGSFVAIQGSEIFEKLLVSDLRMPYKQLLKGRIIIKPGQTDYLLNHLGLGDNATFLAIKATYHQKSVIEEDNYLQWSFYDDVYRVNTLAQLLVLTGNSTNRIPQLFITNPNDKYAVTLDVMVAVIDDNTFFDYRPVVYFTPDVSLKNAAYLGPYNTTLGNDFSIDISDVNFFGTYSKMDIINKIVDHVVESNGLLMTTTSSNYIIHDVAGLPINSISSAGTYSMTFDITDSLNNDIHEDNNVIIRYQPIYTPVVHFNTGVYLIGSTSSPVDTLMGMTFGATLSLTMSNYGGVVSNLDIAQEFINYVTEADGLILPTSTSNYSLHNYIGGTISGITTSGTYSLMFDITDSYGTLDPDKILQFQFTAI